jgi:hypothetical protein
MLRAMIRRTAFAALVIAVLIAAAGRGSARAQSVPSANATHVIVYWGNVTVPFNPANPFGLAPVLLFTDRPDVAAFALEEYFKGPGPEVAAAGYFADVDTGPISDGKVFTLAIDGGVSTVNITQPIAFFGDLSQGRMVTAISWTLTQFKAIDSVTILLNGQPLPSLQ